MVKHFTSLSLNVGLDNGHVIVDQAVVQLLTEFSSDID